MPILQHLGAFISAVLGAVAMTALLIGYHWLFARALLSDGQYVFFVFISAPSGVAAGLGTFGVVLADRSDRKRRAALAMRRGLSTVALPLLYCAMTGSNSADMGSSAVGGFMQTALALLPIYLWGAALFTAGIYLEQKR